MTRAYVLDPTTRAILGLVDQSWERLKYTRRYFGMDTFEMTINRSRLYASTLQNGRLLYLPDEGDRLFLIEQVHSLSEGSANNDTMSVSGRSLEGIAMAERLASPPAGSAYDEQTSVPAETAMKHYVYKHAGAGASAARQLSGLVTAADGAAGASITAKARYQTVFDIVKEIGLLTGIGWEIVYNPGADQFVFDIINGVDRSASVFFDFAFETLEKWEELASLVDSKTVAVVAGQGEGVNREVVTRYLGSEPTGFERREAFIDARDIEYGETVVLNGRGDAFLYAAAGETRIEAGIHQYGSFRYGTHWDLGDLVLVRNEERGISYSARVVEVEVEFDRSSAAPTIHAIIDRPFPTMKEQVNGAGARGGAVDYPINAGAVGGMIIWPQLGSIPTGWLLCDGTAVSRTTYADLFAVIGTTFGVGDGSTTFNLPNMKSRFIVGRDSANARWNAIGEVGGAEQGTPSAHAGGAVNAHSLTTNVALTNNHSLTTNVALSAHTGTAVGDHAALATHQHEMPIIIDGTHSISNLDDSTFGTGASRTRTQTATVTSVGSAYVVAKVQAVSAGTPDSHSVTQPSNHTITQPVVAAHAITQPVVANHTFTQPSNHAAMDVLPPYIALNFIIKY